MEEENNAIRTPVEEDLHFSMSIEEDYKRLGLKKFLKEGGFLGFIWLMFDETTGRVAWATILLRVTALIVCVLTLLLPR